MPVLTPLSKKTRISVVAPCSAFEHDLFDAGLEALRDLGYKPVFKKSMLTRATRYTAGSADARLAELRAAMADPATQAIWAARGGYGAMHLLGCLSLKEIRAAQKPLIGFSDITALHARWHQAGVASIHGPNITTLAQVSAPSRKALKKLLRQGAGTDLSGIAGYGTAVEGNLVGGNLALLASLCGTPYQYRTRGTILFLEEVGERPYRVDRMLTQLEFAGIFKGILGVVLGDFIDCQPRPSDGQGYDGYEVALDFFRSRTIPVAYGFPFGHGAQCSPLPIGALVRLDPETATLSFAR